MKSRDRIVVLGWYGSANTGDEAVLRGTVSALRSRGFTNLHILSTDPRRTSRALRVRASSRRPGLATLKAMADARALVFGGGGLIQDGTSVYNLPLYALFVALARLFGMRVACFGLGVEPIWTNLGKLLTRFIVRASSHFSVRDAESLRLLRIAGVPTKRVQVTADPAYLLPVAPTEAEHEEPPRIIFCLRDLSDNHPGINLHYLLPVSIRKRIGVGWQPPTERREGLVASAAAGIAHCVRELGATVTLLALWPGRDDAIIHEVRETALALGTPEDFVLVAGELFEPSTVAAAITGADLLVSMRLHALIFGAGAGVPLLALTYARKMTGQMKALGQVEWVIEVDRATAQPDDLIRKIDALWAKRRVVSPEVRRAAAELTARANADADALARTL